MDGYNSNIFAQVEIELGVIVVETHSQHIVWALTT